MNTVRASGPGGRAGPPGPTIIERTVSRGHPYLGKTDAPEAAVEEKLRRRVRHNQDA